MALKSWELGLVLFLSLVATALSVLGDPSEEDKAKKGMHPYPGPPPVPREKVDRLLDIWQKLHAVEKTMSSEHRNSISRAHNFLLSLDTCYYTDGLQAYLLGNENTWLAFREWRKEILTTCKIKTPTAAIQAVMNSRIADLGFRHPMVAGLIVLGVPIDGFGREGDPVWVVWVLYAQPSGLIDTYESDVPICIYVNGRTGHVLPLIFKSGAR